MLYYNFLLLLGIVIVIIIIIIIIIVVVIIIIIIIVGYAELHNLYSSQDIIRQVKSNEVGGTCGTHGRGEKSVQGFGGKA
jgi:hypothetical protein